MLDNDDTYDAMADGERRQLLVELLDHDSHHLPTLSSVSREVAGADEALLHQVLSESLDIDGVDGAHVRMHHVHLPRLVACGLVEWERDARAVTRGPRFDDVRPLLELVDDHREDRPATGTVVPLRK